MKQVEVEGRRYIVCLNPDQVEQDRRDREAIVAALQDALRRGDKSLVGNTGYRLYLKTSGERFAIDEEKITTASIDSRCSVCATQRRRPPWR